MKKILIIEDNQEVRENISEILELSGYKVLAAENGKTGVEMAKTEFPDLIICDVMMPELDGYGVLKVLSKFQDTSSIPFIFLTAKAEKEDMRKGMNLGADDYLTKPFDDLELLDAVETRLKKVEQLRSYRHEGAQDSLLQPKGIKDLEHLLSSESRINTVPKKHIIYSENSYPNFVYYINKGKIKTFKIDSTGNELIIDLYKAGDFFGYIDLLENDNYKENAIALEESEISLIKREDFFTLIYHHQDVANKFIKILSDNVREREERLIKLAYNSVRKRVAEALLLLQNKYKEESSQNFSMAISRDDLSGIVGASKETVIRTLTDFKEEGLIQINGSKITILHSDKLSKMKN